ncbi:MAG: hypothetical protein F6K65_43485 [Moorea sp. SIO3C2]|nr:hypothetical protein [Moorena sp. SIO3C2]
MGQLILIVEDEIAIANLLTLELRAEGYDVVTAYDKLLGHKGTWSGI